MSLTTPQVRDLYRQRARRYDLLVRLYSLVGFRLDRYRQLTVDALALQPGDTVVDLGCGTGLNFPYLESAVGQHGHITGVDLTDGMLEQARRRTQSKGWRNVELVQADLGEFRFPSGAAAALSTFAITLVPDFDEVIRRGAAALPPGGRLAVLDFKKPEQWPMWLIELAVWLNEPFGVSLELAKRHPWESIRRHTRQVVFRELYGGVAYLCVGESLAR